MVKFALQLKAVLENIEQFKPSDEYFRWYLRFQCTNCRDGSEKWNYVSLSESAPHRGGAVTHFTSKCKNCSNSHNHLTILQDSVKPYTAEDQGNFKSVVTFDCRGLEPIGFSPRGGWFVKVADNGKSFNDVDLSDGEWADYCDIINQPVSIMDIEFNFQRIK